VADFIGTINMFEGKVESAGAGTIMALSDAAGATLKAFSDDALPVGSKVCIAVRPEKIFISQEEPEGSDDIRLRGVVYDLGYFGNLSLYRIRLASGKIVQVSAQNRRRSAERFLEWDDEVYISWRADSAVVLSR
jgi:putrescine transport system ATP-binding protein